MSAPGAGMDARYSSRRRPRPFTLHSQNPSEHPPRIEVQEGAELSEWDGLDRPEFAQPHRGSVPIVVETERAFRIRGGNPRRSTTTKGTRHRRSTNGNT